MRRGLIAVVAYGILNAIAYSCLLPLWAGFDEPYHYSYVQRLWTTMSFPVAGQSGLTLETWHALELAPVSHYIQPYTGSPLNFSQYFALAPAERAARRSALEALPASEKFEEVRDKPNHEVNQSPLGYLFMAPIDGLLSSTSIITRVLMLRIICSVLSVLLIAHSTVLLSRELQLSDWLAAGALFCVFSAQMLYGTICHVAGDWLTIPAMGYLLLASIRVVSAGAHRDYSLPAVAVSAALLTKAYFLFVTPLAAGVVVWSLWQKWWVNRSSPILNPAIQFVALTALLAGPWYLRNVVLYNNLSATVQTTSGLDAGSIFRGASELPWGRAIREMAHGSLWTGNNSFTTFSTTTLNIMLLFIAVGVVLHFRKSRSPASIVLLAAILLFSAGLAVTSIAFFVSSKGGAIAAVPWYMQVLLPAVMLLAVSGMRQSRALGTILLVGFAILWLYLLTATYLAKLIPTYGGYADPRAHLATLWSWYVADHAQRDEILRNISPARPWLIWTFIVSALVCGGYVCVRFLRDVLRNRA